MTDYIKGLLQYFIVDKKHHQFRKAEMDAYGLAGAYKEQGLTDSKRAAARLKYVLEQETPIVFKEEKIALLRTVQTIPEIYTKEEWECIREGHYVHEQGKVCNINPDYMEIIGSGFDQKRREIQEQIQICEAGMSGNVAESIEFLYGLLEVMDTIEAFALRYREEAVRVGNITVANSFLAIPQKAAANFTEALQFFRLMHYCLWCSFNYHNTIGRFDQYMSPYLEKDLQNGILDETRALELLEEFFISFNKDSDLYTGMQQGDNGQSMVLGGSACDGTKTFHRLSDMCLQASLELKLIDPKINLRVNHNTPLKLYEKGSILTKQGLGFPQYSNDDIVIPALLQWGYEKEDAYNYVVAACWEFIIPGAGMDVPNIDGMSFTDAVIKALPRMKQCEDFETFLEIVKTNIYTMCAEMTKKYQNIYMEPSPVMSLMTGCIQRGADISKGNKYNNYGLHGTGLSTAVDSLAAIQKYVYGEKSITSDVLQDALNQNFEGYDILLNKLRYSDQKIGNNIDKVDEIAVKLLDAFADSVKGIKNDRGGIYRAGTGSAMYYIWHSKEVQATPDGRKYGEPLACNYSPSLFGKCAGPVSIIKSFCKPHLINVANGGPLTIELHDHVFRNEDSIQKVAMFVKSYMDMGGHQMQINAVNRDKLIEAKAHPENHRNLIVRVWGWSGYFVELDEVYQDHIIKRMELSMEG